VNGAPWVTRSLAIFLAFHSAGMAAAAMGRIWGRAAGGGGVSSLAAFLALLAGFVLGRGLGRGVGEAGGGLLPTEGVRASLGISFRSPALALDEREVLHQMRVVGGEQL